MSDTNKPRILLTFLTGAFVLDHFDRHILSIALSRIKEEFSLSDTQLGSLSGLAFAFFFVLLAFPLAKLSTPGRRKPMVIITLAVWSGMTTLMSFAGNYLQLFLARMGVGVGEAGYTPAAHSMIADSWPPEKRTTAFGVFSAGANLGVFLAFVIGGFVIANYGWRMGFLVAGLPGLFLAVILIFTIKEPPARNTAPVSTSYRQVAMSLLVHRPTRHILFGAFLSAIVGYGALAWIATFLERTHGLELKTIGLYLGVVAGIGGAIGSIIGTRVIDYCGQRGAGNRMLATAVIILIAKPLAILAYLSDTAMATFVLLAWPAIFANVFVPPVFSHMYQIVKEAERPRVAALMMFTLNFGGLCAGPIIVGGASDVFQTFEISENSLALAMATLQLIGIWAACHFLMAAKLTKTMGKT